MIYIKRIVLENVKSFKETHKIFLKPGVNFLVGDNNTGKSTLLEALLFLFEGQSAKRFTPEDFYSKDTSDHTRVEVDIAGCVKDIVGRDDFKQLKDYVFEDEGESILRLERYSKDRTVTQNGKEKKLTIKSACFWNEKEKQFENPTGIDARIRNLFDLEAVWATTTPGEHLDFSTTKTLGKLISSKFETFRNSEDWIELEKAHKNAFDRNRPSSFIQYADQLETDLKKIVNEQYGQATFSLNFKLPDANSFMKQGELAVHDGVVETPIENKGTGMQRAVTLGLIQLYARTVRDFSDFKNTPLVLMLDEPETWLHPKAQLKLGDAIAKIGENEQVFITTHSPYLIKKFNPNNHSLLIFNNPDAKPRIMESTEIGILGTGAPSLSEINYLAFDIVSSEFHNELYARIQWYLEQAIVNKEAKSTHIDNLLENCGLKRVEVWKRSSSEESNCTLATYIRHSFHHPENKNNEEFTEDELRTSVEDLIKIVKELNDGSLNLDEALGKQNV